MFKNKERENFMNIIYQVKDMSEENCDSSGCFKFCKILTDSVVLKTLNYYAPVKPSERQKAIANIKSLGFNTPKITFYTKTRDFYFEIQEKAPGSVLLLNDSYIQEEIEDKKFYQTNQEKFMKLLTAPTEHYAKFVESAFIGHQLSLLNDAHNNNVFYDEKTGFSFIDLPDEFPYKSKNEYIKLLKNTDLFSPSSFVSDLFHPFIGFAPDLTDTMYTPITKPYYNLIGHKLLEGFEQSFLCNPESPYCLIEEEIDEIKSELIADNPSTTDDQDVKFFLIDSGIVRPNPNEEKVWHNINLDPQPFANNLKSYQMAKSLVETKSIGPEFFEDCIFSMTINGQPAIDYYKQVDTTELCKDCLDDNEFIPL